MVVQGDNDTEPNVASLPSDWYEEHNAPSFVSLTCRGKTAIFPARVRLGTPGAEEVFLFPGIFNLSNDEQKPVQIAVASEGDFRRYVRFGTPEGQLTLAGFVVGVLGLLITIFFMIGDRGVILVAVPNFVDAYADVVGKTLELVGFGLAAYQWWRRP